MRILITLFVLCFYSFSFGQSATCGDPSPLCVLDTYEYPIGSNIDLEAGNNYGCIPHNTTGIPALLGYYYTEARTTGTIRLQFNSDNDLSVAAWGPFTSQQDAADACGSLPAPTVCTTDPNSNAAVITLNVVDGEFYLILVKGIAPPAYVGQFSVKQVNKNFPNAGVFACQGFGNEVIACPGSIALLECDDQIPSPADNIFEFIGAGGNASNLCTDRVAVTFDEFENGGNGCTGSPRILQRRYYLQDQCGNLATCLQQFSYPILDEPLELLCPASDAPTQLVTCLADLEVNVEDIVALNACGIDLDFDIGEPVINDASAGIECDLTCLHYPVTVTDECGRVGECTISFTVFGNVPEFVFDESEEDEDCRIAPLEVNCEDDIEDAIDNWLDTLSVFSTCGNRLDLTTDFSMNNFVNVCDDSLYQSQEITITAKDACGRTNSCTSTINLIKTEAPRIVSEAKNKWVTCGENVDSIFQAYLADNGGANAIDFCSATTFTTNPANPEVFISCTDEEEGLSIEFIASDACGNTSVTVGVFKVLNDSPITIDVEPMDTEVACDSDVAALFDDFILTQAGAAVNACGDVTWTTIPESPSFPTLNDQCDEASVDITFVAEDACGQTITLDASFTVVDNTAPTMSGGEGLDLSCGDSNLDDINTWLMNNAGISVSDDCSIVMVNNDFDPSSLDGDCYDEPITVTFTAIDVCGNEATSTFDINISDTTPPVFTSIPTMIDEDPVAEDECSEVTITSTQETNGGQTIVTYTATDACGNESSVTVTFGEIDNTPPVITFIPTMVGCDGVLDPNDVIATDDSGQVTVSVTLISETGTCNTGYTYVYEMTATDAAGNETTESVTYNIPADNTPPVFTSIPENMTFFCSEEVLIPEATATDDCDEVTITCTVSLNAGAVVDNCNNGFGYDIFKVWTATDACGNTATAVTEAWVVPDDYVGPRFAFVPESKVMECGDDTSFGEAVCTTACGDVVLTFEDEIIQGDCSQSGQMIRTWTGVDDCGNVATAEQIITIPPDTEAPVFTYIPESKTVTSIDEVVFGTPVCEDNCATINHLDIEYTDELLTDNECGMARTWTVSDMCGNITEATQTFFFDDQEAPIFADAPTSIEVECGANADFIEPTITDNMAGFLLTIVDKSNTNACTGLLDQSRTWKAVDACGNESEFTQTIVTIDMQLPFFDELQSEKVLSCEDAFEFDQAVAYDNCTDIQSIDYIDVDLSDDNCSTCIYKVQRTWTAIDACGNQSTISQILSLIDEEAPSIEINGNAIVEFNCDEELNIEVPFATDNCGDVSISFDDKIDDSNCGNGKSFTRTWIASDMVGNETIATQQFIFVDNEAPIFSEVPFYIESVCADLFEFVTPVVTDACSEVEVSFIDQDLDSDCGPGKKIMRTWTATDACGNQNEFSQTIEFTDDEAPVFSEELQDIVLQCGQDIPKAELVTAIDNCQSNISVSIDETVFPETECTDGSILSRTYSASDDCGNATSMTYNIYRAIDNEPPFMVGVLEDKEIFCGQAVEFSDPNFQDDCNDALEILFTTEIQEDACGMTQTRVWTATDACGNVAEASQSIYWTDSEAPEVLVPLTNVEMTVEEFLIWSSNPLLDAEDNCSGLDTDATIIDVAENEDCNNYSVNYTYSFTDYCGNLSQVNFEISVPNALPTFTLDAPQEVDCGNQFTASVQEVDFNENEISWSLNDPSGTWEIVNISDNQIQIIAGENSAELVSTVTNQLGCTTTTTKEIECALVNSIVELQAIDQLTLYPNPVSEILTIQFSSSALLDAKFNVYDLLGRLMIQRDQDITLGDNQISLNAATLLPGSYLLEIETEKGTAVKKFMKF